jgi:hypothetical protein
MISHYGIRGGLFAAAITLALTAPAFANMPRPVNEGQASYITGGIGNEEQQAMEDAAPNYNLQVTNSERDGAYVAGIVFTIRDREGREVLQARNAGPLFYAQLPPGSYVVQANYAGAQQVKDVTVGGRHAADLHLIWQGNDQR